MIYLSPTPPEDFTLRAKVIRRAIGLSTEQDETWLATNFGDILLQACLIEAWQFLKNQAKMEEAATMYASLLPQAKMEAGKMARRTYAGPTPRPQPQPEA